MVVKLSPCVSTDRPACLELFRSNVPDFFAADEADEFSRFLATSRHPYFVVRDQSAVVACGGCYFAAPIAGLSWGMVERKRHRTGIGAFLLYARLDLVATHLDITTVRVRTSQLSQGFFARQGFIL